MDKSVILSSPVSSDFVECSSPHTKVRGKLFKKMLFRWGSFSHPSNPDFKINVDQEFYDILKKNFDDGVCPIVQVPLCDAENKHTEDPSRSIGRVVDLAADDKGVYCYLDARKHVEDLGETILGASAKFALNYTDTRTGKKVGPTLLHVAATNRPYLVDLDDFETVSASNADTEEEVIVLLSDSDEVGPEVKEAAATANASQELQDDPAPSNGVGEVELTTDERLEPEMNKDELIAALSEHGIDVVAGQQALTDIEGFVSLSSVLGDDVVPTPETLSTTIVDLTNSVAERETRIQELTSQLQEVELSRATSEVESLIEAGRILPAWKDTMIEFSMSDRDRFETFLIPANEADIELSEQGVSTAQSPHQVDPAEAAKAEGARLAKLTK